MKVIASEYIDDFAIAAQNAIQERNYYVPFGSTRTVSREKVPAGFRDIVDSGDLLDSLEIVEGPNSVGVTWTAPHASAVRFGYATYNAAGKPMNRFMPGRDFVAIAKKETPLPNKRKSGARGVVAVDFGVQTIR